MSLSGRKSIILWAGLVAGLLAVLTGCGANQRPAELDLELSASRPSLLFFLTDN